MWEDKDLIIEKMEQDSCRHTLIMHSHSTTQDSMLTEYFRILFSRCRFRWDMKTSMFGPAKRDMRYGDTYQHPIRLCF